MMNDRTADVAEYAVGDAGFNYIGEDIPRVQDGVIFVEVVGAKVAGSFQLIAHPDNAAQLFAFFYGFDDVVPVLLEAQRVVIEGAHADFNQQRFHLVGFRRLRY